MGWSISHHTWNNCVAVVRVCVCLPACNFFGGGGGRGAWGAAGKIVLNCLAQLSIFWHVVLMLSRTGVNSIAMTRSNLQTLCLSEPVLIAGYNERLGCKFVFLCQDT